MGVRGPLILVPGKAGPRREALELLLALAWLQLLSLCPTQREAVLACSRDARTPPRGYSLPCVVAGPFS